MNDYYDVRMKRSNIALLLDKYDAKRLRFFQGDVCDAPFISRIFEKEGIRWVVHMAARAGVRASIEDPFVYVHSNVEATTRLLELAHLHAVKSFVFASSSSVYGGSLKEVSEDAHKERRGHTHCLPSAVHDVCVHARYQADTCFPVTSCDMCDR